MPLRMSNVAGPFSPPQLRSVGTLASVSDFDKRIARLHLQSRSQTPADFDLARIVGAGVAVGHFRRGAAVVRDSPGRG